MPTIDTAKIEGFADMTAEQKLDVILKMDFPDMSQYVSKSVFDSKASEAAKLSKQLKERMTEDEQKKAEEAEQLANLKSELEQLRKDKTVSDWTARYIGMGYDKALAKATAEAMASGDMDTVFANGEKHREELEKQIRQDILKKTPKPDGSGGHTASAGEEQAKRLGREKASSAKTASETLEHYLK